MIEVSKNEKSYTIQLGMRQPQKILWGSMPEDIPGRPNPHTCIWIYRDSGEGMGISKERFFDLIDKYYEENF